MFFLLLQVPEASADPIQEQPSWGTILGAELVGWVLAPQNTISAPSPTFGRGWCLKEPWLGQFEGLRSRGGWGVIELLGELAGARGTARSRRVPGQSPAGQRQGQGRGLEERPAEQSICRAPCSRQA